MLVLPESSSEIRQRRLRGLDGVLTGSKTRQQF